MKIFRLSILLFFVVILSSFGQEIPSCHTLDWSTTSIYTLDCNYFEHGDWVLVYSDDFNSEIDLDEWYTRTPWGNQPGSFILCYNQPENLLFEDGKMKIQFKEEPGWYQNPYYSDPPTYDYYPYTTDEVWTKGKYRYGLIEASLKIPKGPGFVPAFWGFGDCGDEIDIFEFAHAATEEPLITIHKYGECGNSDTHEQCATSEDYNTDFSLDYHKYSVEWDDIKVIFRIDDDIKRIDYKYLAINGQQGWLTNCNNVTPGFYSINPFFPNDPLSIIFGLEMCNNTPDCPFYDGNYAQGPFPSSLDIEYLKVYRKSNSNRDVFINNLEDTELSSAITGRILTLGTNNGFSPIVLENKPLTLIATEKIQMLPGFKAENNSLFSAKIIPVTKNIGSLADIDSTFNYTSRNVVNGIKKESTVVDGEKQEEANQLVISPNPSNGKFVLTGISKIRSIFIYNYYGEQIYATYHTNGNSLTIDLTNHSQGVYYLKVVGNYGIKTYKMIKL
ncbi:MAG: hypothetical protein COW63_04175 [Bacteroidetes bacterium CG18_big_fil_WC_8_21_14_2_50_41_14]|nr:MAG: hypothetical protein COW63_04175 [Bacteroidetes bacterium CG18_big_fil_WC_8_21_14_2_50_41_14]PJB57419.1 MAG: hypothetical protein CO098_11595 [Bacteroidetes bacterium CG_4_9_14_3_um_filter_41_19]